MADFERRRPNTYSMYLIGDWQPVHGGGAGVGVGGGTRTSVVNSAVLTESQVITLRAIDLNHV